MSVVSPERLSIYAPGRSMQIQGRDSGMCEGPGMTAGSKQTTDFQKQMGLGCYLGCLQLFAYSDPALKNKQYAAAVSCSAEF